MDEDTTTPVVPDTGVDETQPVDVAPTEAVDNDISVTDEQEPEAAPASVSNEDTELSDWAANKGLTLDSENAKKAARMAQQAERQMHQKAVKASELEKATNITQEQLPADASQPQYDAARIRNMELKMEVQSWKMNNPEKVALEKEMIGILADPNKKLLVQEGYLSLDDVYKLAKAEAPDNSAAVRSEGKREALQSLAHKQQAAVPTGHATTQSTPKEKPFSELSLDEMKARLGSVRR